MEPQLLEVNFCPDCVRACRYHPEFFNDVFQALFLEPSQWTPNMPITRLL
jgi:tubulin--tyrosine ligase-like protein 12